MENIKKSYKYNKLKISAPTWNKKFDLPDESYSVSDIKNCFKYIIKKDEKFTDTLPIRIHVKKLENRITLKIETGFYLKIFIT